MFFSHLDLIDAPSPQILGCSCRRVNGGDIDGNGLRAVLIVSVRIDNRTIFADVQADFRPRIIDGQFTAEILSFWHSPDLETALDTPELIDVMATAIESHRAMIINR